MCKYDLPDIYYSISWQNFESGEPTRKPNMLHIPVNRLNMCQQDLEIFNTVYQYCLALEEQGLIQRFVTTKSGGVSVKLENIRGARFQVYPTKAGCELRIRNLDAHYYRFIVGHKKKEQKFSGLRAFSIYKRTLLEFGVDLQDLAITNGKEVKETIPSPIIKLDRAIQDRTYEHVHHLDINSAYNAGMIKAFPELEIPVKYMYGLRKKQPDFKLVLNATQGTMQSKFVGYRWAHISKAGYQFTNNMIMDLANRLVESGRRVLAYNTDGIWYQGQVFHDKDEGQQIGQWKNDHIDCQARWKSAGTYEYIENQIYHPVQRGMSTYDKVKPRDEWVWGDIYKGTDIEYVFEEGKGFVKCQ